MCRPSPSGPDHFQAITRIPPNTPKNLVPPGGLPESVQIPLDCRSALGKIANTKRRFAGREAVCATRLRGLLGKSWEGERGIRLSELRDLVCRPGGNTDRELWRWRKKRGAGLERRETRSSSGSSCARAWLCVPTMRPEEATRSAVLPSDTPYNSSSNSIRRCQFPRPKLTVFWRRGGPGAVTLYFGPSEEDIARNRLIREQLATLQGKKDLRLPQLPNDDLARDAAAFTFSFAERPNYPRHNRKIR